MTSTAQTNGQEPAELLKIQQEIANSVDNILASANITPEDISCGPECQRLKELELLKTAHLDAQTNMQTAPVTLAETTKNYYIYAEGQAYYDNMIEQELQKISDNTATLLGDKFNEEVFIATTINTYFNTALISSFYTEELLTEYTNKNNGINLNLTTKRDDILTNDRKVYYETEALSGLQFWHRVWWYIYYILCLVVVIIFITRKSWNSTSAIAINVVTIAVYIFLPYILQRLLLFLYNVYKKIKIMMSIDVYNNL